MGVSLGEQSKRRGQRRALNGLEEMGVYFGGVLPPSDISRSVGVVVNGSQSKAYAQLIDGWSQRRMLNELVGVVKESRRMLNGLWLGYEYLAGD